MGRIHYAKERQNTVVISVEANTHICVESLVEDVMLMKQSMVDGVNGVIGMNALHLVEVELHQEPEAVQIPHQNMGEKIAKGMMSNTKSAVLIHAQLQLVKTIHGGNARKL